jgi:hypothetical protein
MAAKEFREQLTREQRDRVLAVIAEFGGKKPEGRLLVPIEDPANNEPMLRLAVAGLAPSSTMRTTPGDQRAA